MLGDAILPQVPQDKAEALVVGVKRMIEWHDGDGEIGNHFTTAEELQCWYALLIAIGDDFLRDTDRAMKGSAKALDRVFEEITEWR